METSWTRSVAGLIEVICFGVLLSVAGFAFIYALRMRYAQMMMGHRPEVRWTTLVRA